MDYRAKETVWQVGVDGEANSGATTVSLMGVCSTAVSGGNVGNNRQTEPRAGQGSSAIGAIEPVEDSRGLLDRDARPTVLYLDRIGANQDSNFAGVGAEFDRISKQVADGTIESGRIS